MTKLAAVVIVMIAEGAAWAALAWRFLSRNSGYRSASDLVIGAALAAALMLLVMWWQYEREPWS